MKLIKWTIIVLIIVIPFLANCIVFIPIFKTQHGIFTFLWIWIITTIVGTLTVIWAEKFNKWFNSKLK